MPTIDLRDANTQNLYQGLGEGLGLGGYDLLSPQAQQIRSILGAKRNAEQLSLLQDTYSQLDPDHQKLFLDVNAPLIQKLGGNVSQSVLSPAKPPTDQQVQEYVTKALADRFPQANMAPNGAFNPTTDIRSILAGTAAEQAVPGIRQEAQAQAGTPAVLGDQTLKLPFGKQQLAPNLKKSLGQPPEANIRNQEIFAPGSGDLDSLFKAAQGGGLAAASFGIDAVKKLNLDPAVATTATYLNVLKQTNDAQKAIADRAERSKQFNILQGRIQSEFGVNTQKTVNEGLANLELKLDDPKTSDEDRKIIVDQLNGLSTLIGNKGFKAVPKEGVAAYIARIFGNDPIQVVKLSQALQDDAAKKTGGKDEIVTLINNKTGKPRQWNKTKKRWVD